MDYLEPGKIKGLRLKAKQLVTNPDDEAHRVGVLSEIDLLIETSEANRRASNPSNSNS